MKFLCNIPTWLQSIALFMVALGVRLLHITATDIAGDEPFSIFMAQLDIGSIIEHLSKDNSPPIFEILLHYYMLMAGSSDFALRLFPTILNSLIVIPIFLIGKRFFNLRVAVTAALMFIFCIYHIRFAHEIRVYSLFSLVFASNIYFLLSAIQKPNRKVYWIALLVTNLLLLYSHYTSFYILLAQSVCIGLFVPKQYWKYALVTLVLTVIGYSPYLLVFINRLGQVSGTGTWVPTPGWGEIYGNINLILNSKITTVFVLVSVVLGLAISLKQKAVHELVKATKNSFGLSVFILFGFTYVPMFFVSVFFLPMFMDRYVLYTSIPLFLSIAWAVDFLWSSHRYQWIGSAILVFGTAVTTSVNPPNNRNLKEASLLLKNLNGPETEVYVCPEMFKLGIAFHAHKDIFALADSSSPMAKLDSAFAAQGIHFIKNENQVSLANSKEVIYLDAASKFVHPENKILSTFQKQFTLKNKHHVHEIFDVYVFTSNEN